jgi:copper transport protein
VTRAARIPVWSILAASLFALALLLVSHRAVAPQDLPAASPLSAANPAPNALLPEPPAHIALTFGVPIASGSASVRLLGAGGTEAPLGPAQIATDDPTQLVAPIRGRLAAGDYVVAWSARTAADDALLVGAYPFRAGFVANPGAASLAGRWPAVWATILRWLVVVGTALAVGGFAWTRQRPLERSGRGPHTLARAGLMTAGAIVALVATVLPMLIERALQPPATRASLLDTLRAMSLGWWVQMVSLVALALLCLGLLARGRAAGRDAASDWTGVALGLAALTGLSLTSHAAAPLDVARLALEIAHLWAAALLIAGLVFLAGGWRELGTDISRFRTIRWIGGALLAVAVVTGIAQASVVLPTATATVTTPYGQILSGKALLVLAILGLGLLAMVVPRRPTAVLASQSFGAQATLAVLAALLASLLALMAPPGPAATAALAGVSLGDIVPLDRASFAAQSGAIHLLAQPVTLGPQTVVVWLTDPRGAALSPDPAPEVRVTWTPLAPAGGAAPPAAPTILRPVRSGALFTGAVSLPAAGWWQVDVAVTPRGGIASRARFWLVVPDPNLTGDGPAPIADPKARSLFEQGLRALTSLRSVRSTQRLADGAGAISRSQTSVRAASDDRPAAYAETVLAADGHALTQQTIVGDRRWVLTDGDHWVEAKPLAFPTPGDWGNAYQGATGFQFGPREEIGGEICQVVTFWRPEPTRPGQDPAWFAWWVGLASGEVRQEVKISTRHYLVTRFSDFDAPLDITPPAETAAAPATPATPSATRTAAPSLVP